MLEQQLLCRILGSENATLVPTREQGFAPRSERHRLRGLVLEGPGLRWRSHAGDEATRRLHIAALDKLADNGLLVVSRAAASGRVEAAKLTDRGDRFARGLAGLPSIRDGLRVLDDIDLAAEIGAVAHDRGFAWTPDWFLGGLEPLWRDASTPAAREALARVESCLLPLIRRGVVVSGSDIRGRVMYARVAGSLDPEPEAAGERGEASEDCYAWFRAGFEATTRAITSCTKYRAELGEVPLSGSTTSRVGPTTVGRRA